MNVALLGLLAYVGLQLVIGALVARRIRTEDDYLVAGRRIGLLLCSMSVFATWFGAETCVSAAGSTYVDGITRTSVEPFAYGACLLVTGFLFAAALWRTRVTTLADWLRARFGPGVERLAALLIIPTSVFWAAAQIRAFGHVLGSVSGFDLGTGIAIAAVLSVLYTMLGGLLADIITDLIQGIVLVVGLLWLFGAVTLEIGGVGELFAKLDPDRVQLIGGQQPPWLDVFEAWALPICGSVLAPEILSRALAARSVGVARRAMFVGGGIYLAVGAIPVLLGLLGPALLPGVDEPEQFLPELARSRMTQFGFVVFAGALVSAILSTIDSAMLVAASFLSRNLILAGRTVSERTRVWTARLSVVGLGLVAWLLALEAETVFELIEESSGFGSSGIVVSVVFGLFTRVGNARSALLAMAAGAITWSLKYLHLEALPWVESHPFLCSLGAALLAYLLGTARSRR